MIDEQDLQKLFQKPAKKSAKSVKAFFGYLLMLSVLFVVIFVLINFSALYNIINYWYNTDIRVSDESAYQPAVVTSPTENVKIPKSGVPKIEDNHLLIPKINVSAPISWNIVNQDAQVQSALEKGILHLQNTSLPGEVGNVFITGHSSNYFWAKGSYKNVFSLLNKLVVGDLVYLRYKNKLYIYRASSIKIVKPSDTSVLSSVKGSTLTLMTCSPVGTSINRLIIIADQVVPNPTGNIGGTAQTSKQLPGGVR